MTTRPWLRWMSLTAVLVLTQLPMNLAPATAQAQQQPADIRHVTSVRFAGSELRLIAPARWAEIAANGAVGVNYVEESRDNKVIVLADLSTSARGLKLRLDLGQNQIFLSEKGGAARAFAALTGVGTSDFAGSQIAAAPKAPQQVPAQTAPAQVPQPPAASGVTARNATVVRFPNTEMRMIGPKRWIEQAPNGPAGATFVEDGRDDGSIYLSDLPNSARGMKLRIDIQQKQLFFSENNGAFRPLYPIVAVLANATPQAVPSSVTGRNVGIVRYEGADLHMVAPRSWVEQSASGLGATFVEEARDDNSVTLSDPPGSPRGLKLRIDLAQEQILFSQHGLPMRLLYSLVGASTSPLATQQASVQPSTIPAGVTARNVTIVKFAGAEMRMIGPDRWQEVPSNGAPGAVFVEDHRDDQTVYLSDLPESVRAMKLFLNLGQQLISFSDPRSAAIQPLYPITGAVAGAMPAQRAAAPIAAPAPTAQPQAATAVAVDADDDPNVVFEDVPDMSRDDIQQVMAWIQNKVTGEKLPFCWRQSYGRGVGTIPGRVADCPPTYTNNGLTCGRSADTILAGGSVVANCPSGYTNMGLTCYRPPSTYGKSCTIPLFGPKHGCREGYTDNGCFCGRGADSIGSSNFVCPAGYFKSSITQRCHKECPSGYTNTGETCFRGVSTLGMGSMICKPDEEKIGARCFPVGSASCFNNEEKDAGLCYKRCDPGMTGVGPVCWQDCPSGWANCGAGCAKSSTSCGTAVFDQVLAPLVLAANIATMGLATPATGAATAAKDTLVIGGKTIAGTSKVGQGFVKVIKLLQTVNPEGLKAGSTIVTRIYAAKTGAFAAKNWKKVYKVGNLTRKVVKNVYDAQKEYLTAFANDFAAQTSAEINGTIEQNFHPTTARFLKETWGRDQLEKMAAANGFVIAQDVLSAVSLVDITGVTGVVSAYAKPICQTVIPFPCVEGSTKTCRR